MGWTPNQCRYETTFEDLVELCLLEREIPYEYILIAGYLGAIKKKKEVSVDELPPGSLEAIFNKKNKK